MGNHQRGGKGPGPLCPFQRTSILKRLHILASLLLPRFPGTRYLQDHYSDIYEMLSIAIFTQSLSYRWDYAEVLPGKKRQVTKMVNTPNEKVRFVAFF